MIKQRQYRGGYQFAGLVELARELRKRQTSAEALLWQLLRDRRLLGYKFRRQHQFGDYVTDFYCREAGLAIELDGGCTSEMGNGTMIGIGCIHDRARRPGPENPKRTDIE